MPIQSAAPAGKRKIIASNSAWSAIDVATSFLCALIASVLVARAMGPSKLGYYNYILWIANIAGQVGSVGIPLATRKYAAELRGRGDIDGLRSVVATTLRFQQISSAAVFLIGAVAIFALLEESHRLYALIAVASLMPSMWLSVYASALGAAEDFLSQTISSVTSSVVNIVGVISAIAFGWGLVGLASALLISRVTDFVLRRYLYHRLFGSGPAASRLDPELKARLIRFCGYSTLLLLLNIVVWDRSEVLFLRLFCDIKQVAFYTLGFNLVQQLIALPRVFTHPASVSLYVEFGRSEEAAARIAEVTTRYLAMITVPALIGMAAISWPLVRVVYGRAYEPAVAPLAISALFAVARSLLLPAEQLLIVNERQKSMFIWGIGCAAINIGLDLLLIRSHGAVGAAIANGSAQFVASVGTWVLAAWQCRIGFPFGCIGKITAASGLMAAGVLGCTALLSPLAALWLGVPLGILLFAVAVRLLQPFDFRDLSRLMVISQMLPGKAGRIYRDGLFLLIRAPQAELVAENRA